MIAGDLINQDPNNNLQSNQYNTGEMNNPNANTSWMSPTGNSVGSGMNRSMSGVTSQIQPTQPIQNNGTAISAVQNGWMSPNSSGQYGTVNLPGWDNTRTDNDPKQEFGRFVQDWTGQGKQWGGDAVRSFVGQDPRWEIDPNSSQDDPHIRVKQNELDKWKPGTSIYQDVITDAGPGGKNSPSFLNVMGDASRGYDSNIGGGAGQQQGQNQQQNGQFSAGNIQQLMSMLFNNQQVQPTMQPQYNYGNSAQKFDVSSLINPQNQNQNWMTPQGQL